MTINPSRQTQQNVETRNRKESHFPFKQKREPNKKINPICIISSEQIISLKKEITLFVFQEEFNNKSSRTGK